MFEFCAQGQPVKRWACAAESSEAKLLPEQTNHSFFLPQIGAPRGLLTPKPTPTAMPTMSRIIKTLTIILLRALSLAIQDVVLRFTLACFACFFQWSLFGQTWHSLLVRTRLLRQTLSVEVLVAMASMSVSNGSQRRSDRGVEATLL